MLVVLVLVLMVCPSVPGWTRELVIWPCWRSCNSRFTALVPVLVPMLGIMVLALLHHLLRLDLR
jgi:hypothetical protein